MVGEDLDVRPCPMLESPDILQRIAKETGAKSTDLQLPELAEHLCEKCRDYAENWKPCAEKLWAKVQKDKVKWYMYLLH